MKLDSPITATAKRIIRIIDTGYLPDNFRNDLNILMQAALAYEVVTGQAKKRDEAQTSGIRE